MSALGRVALVGAGPGDPALLTVRAVELLRAADVVAHDELVSESVLALVPAHAELLAVGRRAGGGETCYRLHPAVLARAREGRFVVRLKAGDPLVFGRGGEEAEELAAAGIPFEIVPGITAALGAAAYGGIPLTHRGLAAQVVISSGHRAGLPFAEPVRGRTLVLYMAAHELASNLGGLVAQGWAASTPAALIIAATTADERTVTGTLTTLATLAARADGARGSLSKLPALVIVGEVVGVRAAIEWRARLPLFGRRVLVARARSGPSRVAAALRTLGADVVELPHVERDLDESAAWGAVVANLDRYGAVVVASEEAAEALSSARVRREALPPVVAVGASTGSLLGANGIAVTLMVRGACADGLAVARDLLRAKRVLVPVTDRGRSSLFEDLTRLGAAPELVVIARERRVGPARWPSRLDLVVLPASSAAQALYADAPQHVRAAPAVAIGARTESMAHELGVQTVIRARADTTEALVEAALQALAPRAVSPFGAAVLPSAIDHRSVFHE